MATPLVKRLQIKPRHRVRIFNAPDNYQMLLDELPEGVAVSDSGEGPFDVVHLFARNSDVLNREAQSAMAALKPGGVLWISYPKISSKVETDITRDRGWDVMTAAGWRPVTQVSIDDIWSALRFRPLSEVGT
jgi:hypothetical protein